ncbi:hypothetical protein [Halovenus aranensis]|nr:hypothetical protein [Halovenus aranensis]
MAVVYATYYDADGWVIRRVMCDCGSRTIGLPTDGADEVIVRPCTGVVGSQVPRQCAEVGSD